MIFRIGNISTKIIYGGPDLLILENPTKYLREWLRVKVPGAFHAKAFKNHVWDGYRYFCTEDLRFPTGFVPSLSAHLQELGIEIIVQDLRGEIPRLQEPLQTEFAGNELRDYQLEFVKNCDNWIKLGEEELYFPRGVYDAATNAGKGMCMAGISTNLKLQGEPVTSLFLIHNQDIYTDLYPFFKKVFGDVGEIRQGKYKWIPGGFNMAMQKTLTNQLKKKMNVAKDLGSVSVLHIDEGHRAGGDDYARLLLAIPAPCRFTWSGTAMQSADNVKNLIVVAVSGLPLGKITNKELADKKHSKPVKIQMKLNDIWKMNIAGNYREEFEKIVQQSETRLNDTIEFIQDRPDRKIVVAFENIEHGEWLLKELSERFVGSCRLLHGEMKAADRKRILQEFKDCKDDILIANTVIQEGVNIFGIGGVVYYIGGKSKIRLKQFIGRGTRMDENEYLEVLDWYDCGKWVSAHSYARLKTYAEEQFEIVYSYAATKLGRPTRTLQD